MTDTWTWATVTQATPLRIKVDGDTSELDATTDNLVGSLAVSDRVRVHLHADGIIVTGIQGGGNRSNPNLLINSDFMVNQEGNTSGASVAAYAYFLDGWYNASGYGYSAGNITWADVGGVRTLTIGVAGSTRYTREKVEASNTPAGMYTLSWEGTAQGQVMYDGGTDPGYSAGPITVYLNGTATVIIGFRGTGDTLRNVKLEQGTVATPYQPPLYGDNLRACMRYFQMLANGDDGSRFPGYYATSTSILFFIEFKGVMRAAPTIVVTTATNEYVIYRDGGSDTFGSAFVDAVSPSRVALKNTTDVSGASGMAGAVRVYSSGLITADARL